MDDTAGAALEEQADRHYQRVRQTFTDLGLQVAEEKCQAPSYQMLWIGVWGVGCHPYANVY